MYTCIRVYESVLFKTRVYTNRSQGSFSPHIHAANKHSYFLFFFFFPPSLVYGRTFIIKYRYPGPRGTRVYIFVVPLHGRRHRRAISRIYIYYIPILYAIIRIYIDTCVRVCSVHAVAIIRGTRTAVIRFIRFYPVAASEVHAA